MAYLSGFGYWIKHVAELSHGLEQLAQFAYGLEHFVGCGYC